MTTTSLPSLDRRYDLDWLRVGAFALLILYHIGMFYVTWDWHVKSVYASTFIEPIMLLTNTWRIPLLFLVSGAAYRFATDRIALRKVTGLRTARLLIPLLFGMFVIVVPQVYFEVVQAGRFDGSFLEFYGRYLAFEQSFDTHIPTWNHLWYVAYLWVYSLLLLPFIPLLRQINLPTRFPTWLVLVLPVLPLAVFTVLLQDRFPETHALTDDWWNHARYLYLFALGFVIPYSKSFWNAIRRLTWPTVIMAVAAYGGILYLRSLGLVQSELPEWKIAILRSYVQWESWLWIAALLGLAYRYLNHPSKILSYLNEGVYPFYILHQTLIVVLGALITGHHIGAFREAAVLIVGTFLGCWVLYEFFIRRVGVLRVLFGLSYRPRVRTVAPRAAPA